MKQDLIKDVIQGMLPYLNNAQNEKLQEVLQYTLAKYEVTEKQKQEKTSERDFVELFLSAKRIEGCSEKSLTYSYRRHQRIPDRISGKEEIKQGNDRQYSPYPLQLFLLVRGRGLHIKKPGQTHT